MYRHIFIFVLFALVASIEFEENLYKERCLNETGLNPSKLFESTRETKFANFDSEEGRKFGCYMSCLWKAFGVLKDDGTVDPTKMAELTTKYIPNEISFRETKQQLWNQTIQVYTECSEKGETDCETASKIASCLNRKDNIGMIMG